MMEIKKRGRPPQPAETIRSSWVALRLTQAEHEALQNEAARTGMHPSQLIRKWMQETPISEEAKTK